jgi:hypothetical protein
VAVTAKHAACEEKTMGAFEASFTTFLMHPRTATDRQVRLTKTAIKDPDATRLDCLMMLVPAQTWPVEVRPARSTPAEEGETVYLVAVPYGARNSQNVYKGTVRRSVGDEDFAYDFTDKDDPRGFSGAPVLDAAGNIVGVHMGSVKYQDGTVLRRALNMSAAVAACTAPGVPRPATRSATSQPTMLPASHPTPGRAG